MFSLSVISVVTLILVSLNYESDGLVVNGNSGNRERDRSLRELTSAVNRFALNYYKVTSNDTRGNCVSATYSIFVGMSLATNGSTGKTKEHSRRLLKLPINKRRLSLAFSIINGNLETIFNRTFLDMTMIWWHAHDINLRIDFAKIAEIGYKAILEPSISVPPTMIDMDMDSYFTCNVVNQENADPLIFEKNDEQFRIEETIRLTGKYRHGELDNINATFVEIPCLDSFDKMRQKLNHSNVQSVNMFILLPDPHIELQDLEKNIVNIDTKKLFNAEPGNLDITFPKIFVHNESDVNGDLVNMGFKFFSENATCGHIAPIVQMRTVRTSTVLQVIERPATPRSLVPKVINNDEIFEKFTVNRPFIIIIATNDDYPVILQIARYTGP